MKYTEIINDQSGDEPQILALVGSKPNGEPSQILQIQIEQDGQDAYIDLNGLEAKALVEKINEWRTSNGWLKEVDCAGLDLIKAERIRQITHEGFTPDKDLEYTDKELEDYAIFLLTGNDFYFPVGWDVKWKEKRYKRSRRENVIKAAALLAALLNVMVKTEESNVITQE